MTEEEWLSATDSASPTDWLFFDALASDRKLRLLSVALCRSIVPHLRQLAPNATRLLDSVEAFADGQAAPDVLTRHRQALIGQWEAFTSPRGESLDGTGHERGSAYAADTDEAWLFFFVAQAGYNAVLATARHFEERDKPGSRYRYRSFYQHWLAIAFPCAVAGEAAFVLEHTPGPEWQVNTVEARGRLLHEIFGNLFRPATVAAACLTPTVVELARQMYDARDFTAMPILADALQDAGCENEDVLTHCRGEGPHVRGCWVVDLVLGKE